MKIKKLYFLLITLLIAVSIFNLPILNTFRTHIKYKIRMDIINKNFKNKELFVFESSQLIHAKWIDEHEFVLDEEMFDVIKTEKINGESYYHCFKDSHENKVRIVQKFIVENFNFKPSEALEMGIPKVVCHSPQNHFCEKVEVQHSLTKNFKIDLIVIPLMDFRFADFYYQKFNIPPEIYC